MNGARKITELELFKLTGTRDVKLTDLNFLP